MARRKRMHGKRRRKSSALKQRVSDTNPYVSNSSDVQMHPDLVTNIKESLSKPKKVATPQVPKVTSKKIENLKVSELGKRGVKKKIFQEGVKRVSKIGRSGKSIPKWLGKGVGVAALMLDALPAGEGSQRFKYKDGVEYHAQGSNKGKPTRDDNFKRIDYGV